MARHPPNLHDSAGFVLDEVAISAISAMPARTVESARSIPGAKIGRGALDIRGKIDSADDADVLIATLRFGDGAHQRACEPHGSRFAGKSGRGGQLGRVAIRDWAALASLGEFDRAHLYLDRLAI